MKTGGLLYRTNHFIHTVAIYYSIDGIQCPSPPIATNAPTIISCTIGRRTQCIMLTGPDGMGNNIVWLYSVAINCHKMIEELKENNILQF